MAKFEWFWYDCIKIGKDTEKKARLEQEGRRADQYKIENSGWQKINDKEESQKVMIQKIANQ